MIEKNEMHQFFASTLVALIFLGFSNAILGSFYTWQSLSLLGHAQNVWVCDVISQDSFDSFPVT